MQETISVYTVSLGCPKNRVDTENMLGLLGAAYRPALEPGEADVVLINTCAFIQPAVEESVQTILQVAQEVDDCPRRPLLAVTGCLPGRYGKELLHQEMPEVDLWLSFEEQPLWGRELKARFSLPESGSVPGASRLLTTDPGFAYLKIGEGCAHQCAFCTIPSIRGRLRSTPVARIQEEAAGLRDQGVRELCLVAQDLTAYGRDLGLGAHGLVRVLESLLHIEGLDWIRLMYLYPTGLTEDLLRFIGRAGKPLLPYIDVPLQHADPRILSAMGRPFSTDPRQVVDRVYSALPQACLRTSLIVGFPGETEAAFYKLLDFVREAEFWHVGAFEFSAEEGTPAAVMPGQIPADVKRERREELMQVQAEISRKRMLGFVGHTLSILVDRPDPEWPGLFQGRSWFQAPEVDGMTYVSSLSAAPGDMVQAVVEDSMTYDLSALAVERPEPEEA